MQCAPAVLAALQKECCLSGVRSQPQPCQALGHTRHRVASCLPALQLKLGSVIAKKPNLGELACCNASRRLGCDYSQLPGTCMVSWLALGQLFATGYPSPAMPSLPQARSQDGCAGGLLQLQA